MYNRYIPQSDGSFRRSAVREPEQIHRTAPAEAPAPPCAPPEPPPPPPCRSNCPNRQCRMPQKKHAPDHTPLGVGSFLKQLLPGDFTTEDLLIVLLLLLMSGDCPEDQNTALLTLALYLFL